MAATSGAFPSRRAGLAGRLMLAATLLILLAGGLALLDRWFPPVLERSRETSALVLDGQGGLLRGFTTAEGVWRLPLSPGAVDPLYLKMLKAYEDQRFERHFGVDPLALARALAQWAARGRVISGASTLTMQAARLLEPRPPTLAGKLREMLRAMQLEWRFSKDEILSLYLNLAPYGGNLEGLRAAALAYLGKATSRAAAGPLSSSGPGGPGPGAGPDEPAGRADPPAGRRGGGRARFRRPP